MFKHIDMYMQYLEKLPSEWLDVSDMFVVLGDEQRQRILLTFEPRERLNVTQIVSASKLSRTAVSHHLKLLKNADVLKSEKIGKEVYFWINKQKITDVFQRVIDFVKQNT
jgi:DNA-binding transcriptional ArsR family regulator